MASPRQPRRREPGGTPLAPALLAALVAWFVPFVPSVPLAAAVAAPEAVRQTAAAPSPPPLALAGISVTPPDPAVDTLCELRVKIRNDGRRAASRFAFDVRVNEVPLAVYKHLLYFQTVPAGATVELRLYNFWSTETSRPAPAEGQLRVRVGLVGARWVDVVKDQKGTETSTPAGPPVAGLPSESSLVIPMKRP